MKSDPTGGMGILLPPLAEAACRAAVAILEVYGTDFEVDIKEDDSPLTEADMVAVSHVNASETTSVATTAL